MKKSFLCAIALILFMGACRQENMDYSNAPRKEDSELVESSFDQNNVSYWSKDQVDRAKDDCIATETIDLSSKALEEYCICYIRGAATRWAYEDYMRDKAVVKNKLSESGNVDLCLDEARRG